jgi:hypothetical protein
MTRRTDADGTGRVDPIDGRWRPRGMTISGALRAVVAGTALLWVAACGQGGATGGPAPDTVGSERAATEGLVLRAELVGGFVSPSVTAGRLPLVSVYADGRVLTEGPVAAIYPGPALPNVQEQRIDESAVQDLVDRAIAAGVTGTTDLGTPPVADAPSTRFTVTTTSGSHVREVYALWETPPEGSGLTADQQSARKKLGEFLTVLQGPPEGAGASAPYAPTTIAAIATPWVDPQDGVSQPEMAWPGPALPGKPSGGLPDTTCVTATGDQAQALLTAAGSANAATPWVTGDGRWSITFRPLLPDESGCADLTD